MHGKTQLNPKENLVAETPQLWNEALESQILSSSSWVKPKFEMMNARSKLLKKAGATDSPS